MTITISSETERLVREEILSGHFRSVDELILSGIYAWREKHPEAVVPAGASTNSLLQFFRESPLVGLDLDLERDKDMGRDIVL
jgi:Arc/MetJ-type ribon-helix-helix transcriptional regulator